MLSTPPRESPDAAALPTPRTRMSPVSPTSPTIVQIFVVPTSIAAKVPLLTIADYLPSRVNFVRDDSTPDSCVASAVFWTLLVIGHPLAEAQVYRTRRALLGGCEVFEQVAEDCDFVVVGALIAE